MPNIWHRRIISPRNDKSRTTTIVVPPGSANAGSINSILFPPPVRITATTGLSPSWIACNAAAYTPRNCMVAWPVIYRNTCVISMVFNRCRRIIWLLSASSSHKARLRLYRLVLVSSGPPLSADIKPKNRCQSALDNRNMC
ncbi:hypothetical protein BDV26DRAFT_276969 [Aspergillus bertholletiae]|uniref:Uncharacterized protein n=1 Tax=Aspergillus bertholletiae TaxID=1226010 RepID=A0A5N7AM64_9EURO|nr:hypothetical protein BDV26DRAFT_276969 [Aspergillus bertholletiae]